MEKETLCIRDISSARKGPLIHPTVNSAAFGYENAEDIERVFADRAPGYLYSRIGNPSVNALEQRLATLESGIGAVAFASGMAAITAVTMALCKSGANIVASDSLFGGTVSLFNRTLTRFGVEIRYFSPGDEAAVSSLIDENTAMIFAETVANPSLRVTDLNILKKIKGAVPLVLDSTFTSPVGWSAKAMGANIVIHSTTKIIAGHGRVIGGAVVDTGGFNWKNAATKYGFNRSAAAKGRLAFLYVLKKQYLADMGGCMAPQVAESTLMGIETLPLRLKRSSDSAQYLATALSKDSGIRIVRYLGLPDDVEHRRAVSVLNSQFSNVLTLDFGTRQQAYSVLRHLKFISISTNLGDARTLAVHTPTTIGSMMTPEEQAKAGMTEGQIRISVGLENQDDILKDLLQAMDKGKEDK